MPMTRGLSGTDVLTGQRAAYEYGLAFGARDTAAIVGQADDFCVEFLQGNVAASGHCVYQKTKDADCLKSVCPSRDLNTSIRNTVIQKTSRQLRNIVMPGMVRSALLRVATMNPVHLLLVEDDPVSRGFLAEALQRFPARVDAVSDAAQAIALVARNAYSLWLLDANLPDASGEQLLQQLRALHPQAVALCLTAELHGPRLDALGQAGFSEVLQKPLTVSALHAAVRRQLGIAMPAGANGDGESVVWDDAQALRTLGGNRDAMRTLRGLFVAELPTQADTVLRAIATRDVDHIRAELHRLKASCGFVGSAQLFVAVRALHDAPMNAECASAFRDAVQDLLAASPGMLVLDDSA
jgi:CheY-like chemotaxis protein